MTLKAPLLPQLLQLPAYQPILQTGKEVGFDGLRGDPLVIADDTFGRLLPLAMGTGESPRSHFYYHRGPCSADGWLGDGYLPYYYYYYYYYYYCHWRSCWATDGVQDEVQDPRRSLLPSLCHHPLYHNYSSSRT